MRHKKFTVIAIIIGEKMDLPPDMQEEVVYSVTAAIKHEMPVNLAPYLIPQFHSKAFPRLDGFSYIENAILPKSDVVIMSDTDHENARDIYEDMFSKSELEAYARKGYTDIHFEFPESLQPYADQLANRKDAKEFLNTMEDMRAYSTHLSKEDALKKNADMADAIVIAANMSPPIKIHFSLIRNTPKQREQLNLLSDELVRIRDNILSHLDDNPDVSSAADEYLESLYNQQLDTQRKRLSLSEQYRIDNDVILAQKIKNTKDPYGRALILHGAGHGAKWDGKEGHNDLDEHLEDMGFSVNRINIIYDSRNVTRMVRRGHADVSDMNYFPKLDEFIFLDHNEDGIVNGSSVEQSR